MGVYIISIFISLLSVLCIYVLYVVGSRLMSVRRRKQLGLQERRGWLSFLILPLVLLSGCAVKSSDLVFMTPQEQTAAFDAQKACYQREQAKEAKLSASEVLLSQAIDRLSMATGKYVQPCKVTTNQDLQIIAMQETTKRYAVLGDFGKSAFGDVVMGVITFKGIDVLGDIFSDIGSGDTYTLGDGASISDSFSPQNYDLSGEGSALTWTYRPKSESTIMGLLE